MERLLILATGPLARGIPDVISACDDLALLGFVDVADQRHHLVGDAAELPVYDWDRFPEALRSELGEFSVLIASDEMDVRRRLIARVRDAGLPLARVVHPSVIVSGTAQLGWDIVLAPGVIVGPGATIGDHVVVNSAVTVDHDCTLEENIIVAPGVHLAGHVSVKHDTTIGVGASFVPGVTVGSGSVIGAGSVVTKDVPDRVIAAGVPTKVIRSLE